MQDGEKLRQYLIYTLKNSNIIYLNQGVEEPVYDYEEKASILWKEIKNLETLRTRRRIKETLLAEGFDNTDYDTLIKEQEEKIDEIKRGKSMYITEDSTLDDIASQIRSLDRNTLCYKNK